MTRRDLLFLESQQEYPSVSIIVPTHRTMPEREQDRIRVKNALAEAKKRLLKEFSTKDCEAIFANMDAVAEAIDYSKTLDGLALFVNKSIKEIYYVPVKVQDRITIDSNFEVRDILRALNGLKRYWVLVLGEKPTHLYYGLGDSLQEIIEPEKNEFGEDQDGFPFSYLPPDIVSEHVKMGGDVHRDARQFDRYKQEFYRKINKLLTRFTSAEKLPIILVGTERDCSMFKEIAPDQNIVADVLGSYAHLSVNDLLEAVYKTIENFFAAQTEKKIEEFVESIGKMKHAFGIDTVWRVAQEGRVKDLLVEREFSVPGIINPDNPEDLIIYEKSQTPGISDDLVNLLIDSVIEKGGTITFCEPGSLSEYGNIAAILRY